MKIELEKYRKRIFLHFYGKKEIFFVKEIGKLCWNIPCIALFIGFEPKWFDIENWYYDGHYSKGLVIFGIVFGYNSTYDFGVCDNQEE